VAGYSGTPLATKLGIKAGMSLVLLLAPSDFDLELPPGVVVRRQARGRADVVLAFSTQMAKLEPRVHAWGSMVFPSGGLWLAWPKKASVRATDVTDVTDGALRSVLLPLGMVDNKVCAVDATWTALRFVWRRENRALDAPPP
jgi:hypothetical protein